MELFPYHHCVLPFWLLTCSWTEQDEKEHGSAQESPWNFVFYFKYFSWCFSQPEVQSALLFSIAADICIVSVFLWWVFLSQSQSLLYQWGLQFNYVLWKKALPPCFWSYYLITALDLQLYCAWKQAVLVSLTLMGSKQKFTMLVQLLHAADHCRFWMVKNILQFLKCIYFQAENGSKCCQTQKYIKSSLSCYCLKWNLVQKSQLVINIAEKVTWRI